MKNNPVKLRFEGNPKLTGVFSYPFNAYIDFRPDRISLGKIKSDDIGIKIMSQVLPVDFQQGFVCAENKVDKIEFSALF